MQTQVNYAFVLSLHRSVCLGGGLGGSAGDMVEQFFFLYGYYRWWGGKDPVFVVVERGNATGVLQSVS